MLLHFPVYNVMKPSAWPVIWRPLTREPTKHIHCPLRLSNRCLFVYISFLHGGFAESVLRGILGSISF